MAARDLHKQLQTLLDIDPATGKTGLQKILQVRTLVELLYDMF